VEAHGRDGLELGLEVVGHLDQQLGEVLGVLVAIVQHQVQLLLLQLSGTLVGHEEPVEEPVQVEQVVQRLLELLEARFQTPQVKSARAACQLNSKIASSRSLRFISLEIAFLLDSDPTTGRRSPVRTVNCARVALIIFLKAQAQEGSICIGTGRATSNWRRFSQRRAGQLSMAQSFGEYLVSSKEFLHLRLYMLKEC
jgi:hypothetical protein